MFVAGLGSHDLWNPDEPRYATVAREMMETGEFFLPHLDGEVYAEKPPLLFWSIAAASLPFGTVTEWSARLPSALAAWIALLLVHDLGRRLFPRDRTALLSALAFGSCWKILWQSHFGQIDMLLTCLVLVAVWFWARSRIEERPHLVWGFWLFTGFAGLAKGPVGLLPPLLAMAVHLALEKDGAALRQLRWGRGLLLWCSVMLAWLVPAIARGGESYMNHIVFKQTVTRYVDPWHHYQPFHYYFTTVLPVDFLPWFFLLPAALWAAWHGLRGEAAQGERRWWRFLLSWVVVTLLFFSASSAKRNVYLLTLYPALALLVGRGLALMASGAVALRRRWLVIPGVFLAVLFAVVTVALVMVAPGRPEAAPLDPGLPYWAATATGSVVVALALATWWWSRRTPRRIADGALAVAAGMATFSVLLYLAVLPLVDPVKSARGLAAAMDRTMPDGADYAIHPRLDPGVLFYATGRHARPFESEDEVRSWIEAAQQPGATPPGSRWLLVERSAVSDMLGSTDPPPGVQELARDADTVDGYLLWTAGAGSNP